MNEIRFIWPTRHHHSALPGAAFGQRALHPLKSFIQPCADDMVTIKAGVRWWRSSNRPALIVNNMMQKMSGIKRWMLKRGNGDVLQVGNTTKFESLDMQNPKIAWIPPAITFWRILRRRQTCPRSLLQRRRLRADLAKVPRVQKAVAQYINDIAQDLQPLQYDFCSHRSVTSAWSPESFRGAEKRFAGIQKHQLEAAFSSG